MTDLETFSASKCYNLNDIYPNMTELVKSTVILTFLPPKIIHALLRLPKSCEKRFKYSLEDVFSNSYGI